MKRVVSLLALAAVGCAHGRYYSDVPIEGCGVNGGAISGIRVIDFPGNENFRDHFFTHARELARMADVGPVEVGIFDDTGSPGAFAFPRPIETNARWAVMFGQEMLWTRSIDRGDNSLETVVIWAILAHEFAHVVQFAKDIKGPTYRLELMADVMAGWNVADILMGEDNEPPNRLRLEIGERALARLGDYMVSHRDHHGTPGQRASAYYFGTRLRAERGIRSWKRAFEVAFFLLDCAQITPGSEDLRVNESQCPSEVMETVKP